MNSTWTEVTDTTVIPDGVAVDELNVLGGMLLNSEYAPFDYERCNNDLQRIIQLQNTEYSVSKAAHGGKSNTAT